MTKLQTPRIHIVMDDGTVYDIQTRNVDLVAFDRERGRHRDWPAAQDGPFLWGTFLAWHHLRRTGQLDMTLTAFEQAAAEVRVIPDDQAGEETGVDPTRTDPEPG